MKEPWKGSVMYYSHSKKIYDMQREEREVALISKRFPESIIYNPNNESIRTAELPMTACMRVVGQSSTAGVVFSVYQGHVGKGVYTEVERAWTIRKLVYMIQEGEIIPFSWCLRLIDKDWWVKYAVVERGR
jgi:hypothetical protein